LTLDYINLADTVAEQILALWDALYGTYKSLRIPITMLTGVNQQLAAYMLTGGKNSQWFFAEVPKWVGKIKGYGDLNVMLVSQPVMLASAIGGNFPFIPIASIDGDLISDYTSCDYTGQSPDLTDFTYVRWVGTQYQRSSYGGSGGGGPPTTFDVTTNWRPLRTSDGKAITYGLGGVEFTVASHLLQLSAAYYLGPWYSNIDVYVETYFQQAGVGGSADVFFMYSQIEGQLPMSSFTNYGMGINFARPDSFDLARSRGRWEFANSNYNILSTWEGYSKLRPA
jgi:hypothetical protein